MFRSQIRAGNLSAGEKLKKQNYKIKAISCCRYQQVKQQNQRCWTIGTCSRSTGENIAAAAQSKNPEHLLMLEREKGHQQVRTRAHLSNGTGPDRTGPDRTRHLILIHSDQL